MIISNKFKALNWWVVLGFLAFYFLGAVSGGWIAYKSSSPVLASGTISVSVNQTNQNDTQSMYTDPQNYWSTIINQETADNSAAGLNAGWMCVTVADKFRNYRGILGFDLTTVPASAEILSISVTVKVYKSSYGTSDSPYFGMYLTELDGAAPVASDYGDAWTQGKQRISDVIYWGDLAGVDAGTSTWETWTVYEENIPDVINAMDGDNNVWFTFATLHDMLSVVPTWQAGADRRMRMVWAIDTYPYITVEYVEETGERVVQYDINSDKNPAPTGAEVADNITWCSPRLSYYDECIGDNGLYFQITGESGADIILKLVDSSNRVMASTTDEVRDDGNYDWLVKLTASYTGWLRCIEENNNLIGKWGYVAATPSPTQAGNTIQCYDTYYPQYNYDFSPYQVYENGLVFVHWKTNVQSDELDTHLLQLWYCGDNVTGVAWSETLEWLNSFYYYDVNYEDNEDLAHWRYAIFTPRITQSGYDTRDGLIINLGKTYTANTAGFYQPVIYKAGVGELTTTHSSFFYIPTLADGIGVKLDKISYNPGEQVRLTITIGAASRVATYMPAATVYTVDSYGAYTEVAGGVLAVGSNTALFTAPAAGGAYECRLSLTGVYVSWSYVRDLPLTVKGAGATATVPVDEATQSLKENIEAILENLNLDNTAGHWISLLAAMLVLFLLCYKSEVLRVVFPLGIMGIGIILGWVDVWVIALLSLGAGVFLFSVLRKRIAGGGNEV